ncbi:MAG: hypothetical protein ACRDP8_24320 [Actinopolymorphaceae bacterium]
MNHTAGNAENRAAMKELVDNGMPVGVLGYLLDDPVAWCAVAPRAAYESIVRSRTLPIDDPGDETIWAVNCLFIRAGFRQRGLTLPMVEAAVEYARQSGARIVEAYPVEILPGDTSRGTLGTFLDAGFSVYAKDRTTSKRNVVVGRTLRSRRNQQVRRDRPTR